MELFQCGLCQLKFSAVCDFYEHFQEHGGLLSDYFNSDLTNMCSRANKVDHQSLKNSPLTSNSVMSDDGTVKADPIQEVLHVLHSSLNTASELGTSKITAASSGLPGSTQTAGVCCLACKHMFPTLCAAAAHLKNKSFYFSEHTRMCIPQTLSCLLSVESHFSLSVELRKTIKTETGDSLPVEDLMSTFDYSDLFYQDRELAKTAQSNLERNPCESVNNLIIGMQESPSNCKVTENQSQPDIEIAKDKQEEDTDETNHPEQYHGDSTSVKEQMLDFRNQQKVLQTSAVQRRRGRPRTHECELKLSRKTSSHFNSEVTNTEVTDVTNLSASEQSENGVLNSSVESKTNLNDNKDYLLHNSAGIKTESSDERSRGQTRTQAVHRDRGRPRKPDSELKYPRKKYTYIPRTNANEIKQPRPKKDRLSRTECGHCGRTILHCNLKLHQKTCMHDKQFACSTCDARFATIGGLKGHYKAVHLKANSYQCEVCGASFFVPSKLAKHMRNHTNERSFVCAVCNKTFKHPEYLKRHEKLHTGIKDQVCSTCGKMFYSNWNLSQHELTHQTTGAFPCPHCGRTFTTKRARKKHQQGCHLASQQP